MTSARRSALVRACVALVALCTLGPWPTTSPTSASPWVQERPWVSRTVAAAPRDAAAYWTPARMKKARPMKGPADAEQGDPIPLSAGPFQSLSSTTNQLAFESREIARTEVYPYSAVGKVFFSHAVTGADYVCSGAVVSNEDEDLVWTAGHCVHPGSGAWKPYFENWIFVPGYMDGTRPFGAWAAEELYVLEGWRKRGNLRLDVGAARVRPVVASGGAVAETVGALGIRFHQPRRTSYWALGYPAAGSFNGRRMWSCFSPLERSDTDISGAGPVPIGLGCDMTGGASGGPWVDEGGYLRSVTSYGYVGEDDVLFGPYFGAQAEALYYAVGGDDGKPSGHVGAPAPDRRAPRLRNVSASPDPFTPLARAKLKTRIRFRLSERARVTVTVHRKTGARVARLGRQVIPSGRWLASWDGYRGNGRLAPRGVYIYKIKALDGAGNLGSARGRVRLRR